MDYPVNVDSNSPPANDVCQKLRELSLRASSSCVCVSATESSPELGGWQTCFGDCRAHLPNQGKNCITMNQVEKRSNTGKLRKARPPKYMNLHQLHKNFSDKYQFYHHDRIEMYALEYRAASASPYRQMSKMDDRTRVSERTGECCCHKCPLVQVLPDMVQQSTAVMRQTQQLLDKLEAFSKQDQMSLHVEWKLKNVSTSGRERKYKMARTSPMIATQSPQVVSQLAETMKVMTYFKDLDPLSVRRKYKYGRACSPDYPDWGEDDGTCTTCVQSYNTCTVKPIILVDYSHCIKPAPRVATESRSKQLVARSTPKKELKDQEAGRCVAMHQVMQSSWKRRPPLLERRKSAKTAQPFKDKVRSACPSLAIPKEAVKDKVALYNIELSNYIGVSSVSAHAPKKQVWDT